MVSNYLENKNIFELTCSSTALMIYSGFKLRVKTVGHHLVFLGILFIFPSSTSIIKTLYNVFDLIPRSVVPFVILGDRLFQSLLFAMFLTYFMSIDSDWISSPKTQDSKDKRQRYSFMQGVCRLSYSLYLVNYVVVKTEFFTSRTVFSMSWYNIIGRTFATLNLMIFSSVVFHLLFVAPFDNLRRSLVSKLATTSNQN